jgi:hypothetical protein
VRYADLPRPGAASTVAAICPPAPLLAPELTGIDPVIPELREACAAVAERLVESGPDVIAVVGTGPRTAVWPAAGRLNLGAFAPALGRSLDRPLGRSLDGEPAGAPLPLSLGLGARLLDEAGYRGTRFLQSLDRDEPAEGCLRLGADLGHFGELGDRLGLLVMADGSACRSLRAPGYLNPAAAGFDAVLERAVRGGNLGPLRTLDLDMARELLVAGRPGWQVLAGAMPGGGLGTEVLYADDPFGVYYLVGWLAGAAGS